MFGNLANMARATPYGRPVNTKAIRLQYFHVYEKLARRHKTHSEESVKIRKGFDGVSLKSSSGKVWF